MESKVIQISSNNINYSVMTTALCEDGSIWQLLPGREVPWHCVLPPFKEAEDTFSNPKGTEVGDWPSK